MNLTPAQLELVKSLTDRVYKHLAPEIRLELNRQLLEARYHWDLEDWLERMELTARYYEQGWDDISERPRRRNSRKAGQRLIQRQALANEP